NLDMNMAKFGLDSDGDIFLAVELPTENFTYSHFADALNGISHHAERLYSEVFNLAHNPDIIKGRFDEELARLNPQMKLKKLLDEIKDSIDEDRPMRPLDDEGLSDEELSDSQGPIIAGKEVRIVDGEDGSIRIEFQTAHDFEDEDEDEKDASSDEDEDEGEVPPIPSDLLEGVDSNEDEDTNDSEDEQETDDSDSDEDELKPNT
ncbi:MAG: hypothetical protein CUN55_07850, partial [Phototrophicales bacterium]